MIVHVLPGDAIVDEFEKSLIPGEKIVCRECLIEGNLRSADLDEFWRVRAEYLLRTYGGSERSYMENTAAELQKLANVKAGTEVNLWFEYELFCQANLWFCLHLLNGSGAKIFRVAPAVRGDADKWKGFGTLKGEKLRECFDRRIELTPDDVQLGAAMWKAFANADHGKLNELAEKGSDRFPYLNETAAAASAIATGPHTVIGEIIGEGVSGFADVFEEFTRRAGVYGFGDVQVRRLLAESER